MTARYSILTAQQAFNQLLGLPGDKPGEKYGCTLEHMQIYKISAEALSKRVPRAVSTDEVTAVWLNAESVGLVFDPIDGTNRSPQFTKASNHTLDDLLQAMIEMGVVRQIAARWPEGKRPPYGLICSSKEHVMMARPGEWELICRIDAASREEGKIK